ncbi:MAG: hypothetical protein IJ188_02965 [Clostridia bacterium]|nr:hypothetical protein [Clostridia bacterium]
MEWWQILILMIGGAIVGDLFISRIGKIILTKALIKYGKTWIFEQVLKPNDSNA